MKGKTERGSGVGSLKEKPRRSFSPRKKRRGDTRKPVAWIGGRRKEKTNGKDTWRRLKEETEESVS